MKILRHCQEKTKTYPSEGLPSAVLPNTGESHDSAICRGVLQENWMMDAESGGKSNPSELSEARIKRHDNERFGMVSGFLTARLTLRTNLSTLPFIIGLFSKRKETCPSKRKSGIGSMQTHTRE
jgi:hypothetical protein